MHVGGAKAILWPAARLALQEVRIAGSMGFDPRNDMVLGSVRIGIGCVDVVTIISRYTRQVWLSVKTSRAFDVPGSRAGQLVISLVLRDRFSPQGKLAIFPHKAKNDLIRDEPAIIIRSPTVPCVH